MGENSHKLCYQQGLNLQNIQTTRTTQQEKKRKKEKWAEDLNRHFSKEDKKDGQQANEKMLNITDYQGNANQNYNEVLPHTSQTGHHQ